LAPATCSTIAKDPNFCIGKDITYDAGSFASKCATARCTATTAADQKACCKATTKQIKVVVTATLIGMTEKQVTPKFINALKSTYARKAGVDSSQVTLKSVNDKFNFNQKIQKMLMLQISDAKAATRRLTARGNTLTVIATIAVTDASTATKVSGKIAKVKPVAFIATLKTELVKEGSAGDLKAVTATIEAPATTGVVKGRVVKGDSGITSGSTLNTASSLGAALVAVAVAGLV